MRKALRRTACIIASEELGDSHILLKVRDRNYVPYVKIIHDLVEGTEVAYMTDTRTGWVEGMNEFGIGIVNSALSVKRDEDEVKTIEDPKKPRYKDGDVILQALGARTLEDASARILLPKLRGHTLLSDGRRSVAVEIGNDHQIGFFSVMASHVRTNHGMLFPSVGYQGGPDRESSEHRMESAIHTLGGLQSPLEIVPELLRHRMEDPSDPNHMIRDTSNMRTTSIMVLDITRRQILFYLFDRRVEFRGVENHLPDGRDPKIAVSLFHIPEGSDTPIPMDRVLTARKIARKYLHGMS